MSGTLIFQKLRRSSSCREKIASSFVSWLKWAAELVTEFGGDAAGTTKM